MNGNMIRQIRQQQMKREERACQEEVIHRVQIVAAQRGQNEHQKEKEEQRHGREVADPPRQRSRLQLLRHLQCDVEPGYQILVIPLQLPAARRPPLFRRRKRTVREVETGKIRLHQQAEVARLRNFLAALLRIFAGRRTLRVRARKCVAPTVQSLRAIGRAQHAFRAGRQARPRHRLRPVECQRQWLVVQKQLHVVVHRLLRRKGQSKDKFFFPRSGVLEGIGPLKIHFVRAEPQQALLPVIEVQGRRNPARVNSHGLRVNLPLRARDFLPLLFHFNCFFFSPFVGDRRPRLCLRRSPGRSHAPRETRLRIVRSVENGGSENGPGNRGEDENRNDRRNALEHGGLSLDSLRRNPNLPRQVGIVKYFSLQSTIAHSGPFSNAAPRLLARTETKLSGYATYRELTLSVSTFDVTVGSLCKGVRQ